MSACLLCTLSTAACKAARHSCWFLAPACSQPCLLSPDCPRLPLPAPNFSFEVSALLPHRALCFHTEPLPPHRAFDLLPAVACVRVLPRRSVQAGLPTPLSCNVILPTPYLRNRRASPRLPPLFHTIFSIHTSCLPMGPPPLPRRQRPRACCAGVATHDSPTKPPEQLPQPQSTVLPFSSPTSRCALAPSLAGLQRPPTPLACLQRPPSIHSCTPAPMHCCLSFRLHPQLACSRIQDALVPLLSRMPWCPVTTACSSPPPTGRAPHRASHVTATQNVQRLKRNQSRGLQGSRS